jgi:hypothetical protein
LQPAAAAAPALDPNRFSLLKRPVADQADPLAALRRPIAAPPNR